MGFEGSDLNLEATELRLGLPGSTITKLEEAKSNKRSFPDMNHKDEKDQPSTTCKFNAKKNNQENIPSPLKAQVVGWPPVRSYRKNCLQAAAAAKKVEIYVKVSMDGAPYLRKIDLNLYTAYPDLLKALEDMFHFKAGEYSEREGYNGSEFVPTYEDKDGDWMLVGDVPWDMFINSCKRLRIMKGSEAKGLGCAV